MRKILDNDYQKFYIEQNKNENGERFNKITAEIRNGIVIIPSIVGGYLVEFHERLNGIYIEFPRGFQELGETPIESAKRELFEELNIDESSINNIEELGYFNVDSAWIDQRIYAISINLKEDLSIKSNEDEGILNHKWINKEDFETLIKNNSIHDAITLSAYQLLRL